MKKVFFLILLIIHFAGSDAQVNLSYYLPEIQYDEDIASPESFFGYQIGEWHIPHSLMIHYMTYIAEKSERVIIHEYARSYESRPLVHLIITSEKNHKNLETIQKNHLALTDPQVSANMDVTQMPAVVMLGYGIHGNEQSAHNAAPLVAYYLAAGQSKEIEEMLDNLIIIIDPSLNPDGQDRFASWVNRFKSHTLNSDPANIEFNEPWPNSRTNHYWFDLNRDWLAVQDPGSYGRVREFHKWKPNLFNDHHEMGTNSTFFFQPGPPERVNPLIVKETEELASKIANYHSRAFDEIGQLYFSSEIFDDFNFGMGYTYPDLNGSIGILFEQASTRGHRVETVHGIMDFAQTIRNQVIVSLSTIKAGLDMREDLHNHLRKFYSTALQSIDTENTKAWIFGDRYDRGKNYHFLDILHTHNIEVFELSQTVNLEGNSFSNGNAWIVPLQQPQSRLIRTLFEKVVEFNDSTFYDISTWTKPLTFNMPYSTINSESLLNSSLGKKVEKVLHPAGEVRGGSSTYAYLFQWDDYYAPKALYFLQNKGLRTKVATLPLTMNNTLGEQIEFNYGTILIHAESQECDADELYEQIDQAAKESGIVIHAVQSAKSAEGITLGSNNFVPLKKPEILMFIGPGTSFREAGEIWHLLDQRYKIPVTKVDISSINNLDISRYNTIIMVSASYDNINDTGKESLNSWLRKGGTLIATGGANRWLNNNEFIDIEYNALPARNEPEFLPYRMREQYRRARGISGSIFQAKLDITHPVGFGYRNELIPVFVLGTTTVKPSGNPFSNPLIYTDNSYMSGYAWEPYKRIVDNTAGILISSKGNGNIVSFINNPNFRGFWFGTNKLFANSLFFGRIINN